MKRYLLILSLGGILAVVLLVGIKLNEQAIAVIIGMGLGMLASIPSSLLIVFILTQKERQALKTLQNNPPQGGQYPPVVVVTGGNQPTTANPQSSFSPSMPTSIPSPRTFTVVGEESIEL